MSPNQTHASKGAAANGAEMPAIRPESYNGCYDSSASLNPNRTLAAADRIRAATLRKYHLTAARYQGLHRYQAGLCAICQQPETTSREGTPKHLAVDHDPATGRVRALLCARCNMALGLFKDNPELLRVAADYLDEHAQPSGIPEARVWAAMERLAGEA